uniref:DAC domain-containing protein n=1 Tax=Alexandrium monilatum TaxID=311494 RepID=A0A7S4PWQ4_9DINO
MAVRIAEEAPPGIGQTLVLAVEHLLRHAQGGCAIAIASKRAFFHLKVEGLVDYQVADRDEHWQKGYMSTRIGGINLRTRSFEDSVRDFSAHSEGDRWPLGHEAAGLPKDGFLALVDPRGRCLKGAVRLIGLPTPPLRWDNVGTRHLAALGLCWALWDFPAAVVVRSDAGLLHVLLPQAVGVRIIRTACMLRG